jgi:ribosomal protein L11 methyltransferase
VTVPTDRAEEARATMLELFPDGFEEVEHPDGVELAAYTDPGGEEQIRAAFGGVAAEHVPADWAERWRRFHRPVQVGRLWLGPPWEEPADGAVAVVIDPGRAFGTGGHATTRLCLELLAELEPRGSLLDVGCGSGVLAIAAGKLGFAPVVAIDRDDQAVEVARANAAANGVELVVELGDAERDPLPSADLAVANVTLEAVEVVGPRLDVAWLITSGYLVSQRPTLPAFRHVTRREQEGWAADLWEGPSE